MDKPVRIASTVIIVLVIVGIVIKERAQLVERISESFAIVITLNIATMLVGFFTAKMVKLKFKEALTICLESGNQNGTLAIQVSSLINITLGFPAAVYSLFMYFRYFITFNPNIQLFSFHIIIPMCCSHFSITRSAYR